MEMPVNRSVIAYATTLVVFALVDFVWLGFVAKDLYRNGIGHLMAETPNWTAAVLFYLAFVAGLVYFAVLPGLDAGAWQRAARDGALFGFFCYATYDLTNYATLRNWPLTMVVADLAWGAFVSTVAATVAFFVTRALGR
jgi:uncharacterized membrane protein